MGFSISSPELVDLADDFARADPVAAYHRAAANVGAEFVEPKMAEAFSAAEAGDDLLDDLGTYIHQSGSAYVGIPGGSRHSATAHEIEFGSPFRPPAAPIRTTAALYGDAAGAQLTEALDHELGRELDGDK